jgi:type II secretory pathway pseudopilin PulG
MRLLSKKTTREDLNLTSENGVTLVEELVTVAIIAFGLVILVAMITTGVIGVRQVDDFVTAESLARSQLELIKDAAYEPDPGTNPYPGVAGVPGYVVVVGIEYWNATTSTFVSTQRNDGMQRITVTVSASGDTLIQTSEFKVDR